MSKDGGPAFPVPSEVIPLGDHMSYVQHAHGMTLRDYFAAQAMVSVAPPYPSRGEAEDVAKFSYAMADAMLRARASGEG